ncbi:MAG: hypothetical protein V4751_07800 [Pseudomonadota bacterium]
MLWLYELPLWVLCCVVVLPGIGMSMAGVYVVRRLGWMLAPDDNGTAGFAHAFIGVLYAVALGLMVVGVQSSYSEVDTAVMNEANLIGDLYRDVEGLAEPIRSELQELLLAYIDAVIAQEWPALAAGALSDEHTWRLADELARRIITYQPSTDVELVVFAEVLDDVNLMLDQRRERLHLGTSGVGLVTWAVVLVGAIITIGVALFYNTASARAHYWLVGMMASMYGLMIFLIVAMDHPLWGDFSVSPDAFVEVQINLQRWDAESATLNR